MPPRVPGFVVRRRGQFTRRVTLLPAVSAFCFRAMAGGAILLIKDSALHNRIVRPFKLGRAPSPYAPREKHEAGS